VGRGRTRSRTGIYTAVAAIAATTAVGAVGAAGANESADVTVYASEDGLYCFTTDAADKSCDAPSAPAEVTVQPGDTVTWDFTAATAAPHNAVSSTSNWSFSTGPIDVPHEPDPASYTFSANAVNGDYKFVCGLHPNMTGTIHLVGGSDTHPDPAPTPTPTPTPQPGGGGTTTTPNPSGGTDTVKPRVSSVKSTALRRAVRVRFTLSEPATVTIRVKRSGSRKVLKSARVQARAGARSVTLRSKALKKGRYTVEIQARDAFGNRSSLARKRLRLPG
jgi:plastocyanin